MRIGVVSDTHDNLGNVLRIVELFNASGVERVIHTGDITQPKTIHALAALEAPLMGVYGNNDKDRPALDAAIDAVGFDFMEPPFHLTLAERRIVVVHDPRDLEPELGGEHALALHGHTHLHTEELRDGTLVVNPGECAGHLTGHNAIGVVDLASLSLELIRF